MYLLLFLEVSRSIGRFCFCTCDGLVSINQVCGSGCIRVFRSDPAASGWIDRIRSHAGVRLYPAASGGFDRIRSHTGVRLYPAAFGCFCSDPVGFGCFCRIRIRPHSDVLVGSGCFGRILIWPHAIVLVGSRSGYIRLFWSKSC